MKHKLNVSLEVTGLLPLKMFFKCHLFLWCKADFPAPLHQSSVSHHPSEIILIRWFAAQETFFSRCLQVWSQCGFICNKYIYLDIILSVCYVTGNDADVSLLSGAAVGAEVHDEGQEQ